MIYHEEAGNLFALDFKEYAFAQCISADFAMGKGIAVQFQRWFNVKNGLKSKYGNFLKYWDDPLDRGKGWCLYCNNVYNLITKRNYWDKPTKETLQKSLNQMKKLCIKHNTKKLAMPKIACGLDGMHWNTVSDMIKNTFDDMDIEILVKVG
jgi:hypothetical protein